MTFHYKREESFKSECLHVLPCDRFSMTYNMSGEQLTGERAPTSSCTEHPCQSTVWFLSFFFSRAHLLLDHARDGLPCYSERIYGDDNDRRMMTVMMLMWSRMTGLTLGTQSICAVLRGLAVPFAHPASVSGCRGVALATPLPLTLAAAHGPDGPLVPAAVNCNTRRYKYIKVEEHNNRCSVCVSTTKTNKKQEEIIWGTQEGEPKKDERWKWVQNFGNYAACLFLGKIDINIMSVCNVLESGLEPQASSDWRLKETASSQNSPQNKYKNYK